jgi:hypothetical protein
MRIPLVLSMGLFVGHAQANCDEMVSSSEFAQQVSLGDSAFVEIDFDAFGQAIMWVDESLPCLSDGLSSDQVTSLHRLQALSAFTARDPASATLFLQAVLATAPNYELPDSVAPDGHPLRLHFDVARGMPMVPPRPVPTPRRGWIQVDGQSAVAVPQERPYLFQYFDENGLPEHTALLMPGMEPPNYPGSMGENMRLKLPLVVASGLSAVASGVFYGMSSRAEARFWDPETADSELEGLQLQANGLAWASMVMGTAAAGSGIAAVWTGSY